MSQYDVISPVGIYHKNLEYWKADVQKEIMAMNDEAILLDQTQGPIISWLDAFLGYAGATAGTCSTAPGTPCDYSSSGYDFADEAAFLTKLDAFQAIDDYKTFNKDLARKDAAPHSVEASRSWMFHIKIGDVPGQIGAMDEIVDFVDKNADKFSADPFADSWIYVYTFHLSVKRIINL